MSGLNDSPRHIRELCRLLDGIKCRINLIRFHKIPRVTLFLAGRRSHGAFARHADGQGHTNHDPGFARGDIQAACGLLSTSALEGGQ